MTVNIAELFGLKPPKVYKGKNAPEKTTNDDLLVGLELEVENLPNGYDWYVTNAGAFWTVAEDGSLRPRGQAWEFISKPAQLGLAMMETRLLFEKMKWTDANYSDRCSIHVHTNVQDFTKEQMANLSMVYPVFEAVLFEFVNHYKKREEQGYCRDTNLYCIPWSDCRMNRNFITRFFDDPNGFIGNADAVRRFGGRTNWQKYTALNLLPVADKGTVEWRHMHGTADMDKLSIWLNMIGSIMRFCKEQSFDDIVKTIKVLNDVSTYQTFFNSVLGNTLPYKEGYRAAMATGVVAAKYSLINLEADKDKPKTKSKEKAYTQFEWTAGEMLGAVQEEQPQPQPQPRPANPPQDRRVTWGQRLLTEIERAEVEARQQEIDLRRAAELQRAAEAVRGGRIARDTARVGPEVRIPPIPRTRNRGPF